MPKKQFFFAVVIFIFPFFCLLPKEPRPAEANHRASGVALLISARSASPAQRAVQLTAEAQRTQSNQRFSCGYMPP